MVGGLELVDIEEEEGEVFCCWSGGLEAVCRPQ